jgi:hypothetical protein
MRYNPDVAPVASQWLALGEADRMVLCGQAHDADLPNHHLHLAIHAAVETQIALDMPSVVDAVARLRAEGLGRHDTIHAIGAVLAAHMWEMMRPELADVDPNAKYYAALGRLTVESWRRDYDPSFDDR